MRPSSCTPTWRSRPRPGRRRRATCFVTRGKRRRLHPGQRVGRPGWHGGPGGQGGRKDPAGERCGHGVEEAEAEGDGGSSTSASAHLAHSVKRRRPRRWQPGGPVRWRDGRGHEVPVFVRGCIGREPPDDTQQCCTAMKPCCRVDGATEFPLLASTVWLRLIDAD